MASCSNLNLNQPQGGTCTSPIQPLYSHVKKKSTKVYMEGTVVNSLTMSTTQSKPEYSKAIMEENTKEHIP